MAFIGNTNITQAFTPAVDFFSGNASTTAFTLSRPVAATAQVQAVIENVPQDPGSAFTVSGNTITFTSAPPSGTNNIYVYYTSPITQVIAPGQGTVSTTSLANGTVNTSADIVANGLTVGKGSGSVATNTAVGYQALQSNTTAANATAVGYQAGYSNVTGTKFTAVGFQAGYANTANNLTAFGYMAAVANTTGGQNTAIGSEALAANNIGTNNVALGTGALNANTTGSQNTAIGKDTLVVTTTGGYNTAIGYQAGKSLTATGPSGSVAANTLVGALAGFNLTTGYGNTIVGAYDNSTNAVPGYFITTGNNNTILGGYNGNQGGLDIRTSSNYIVLSDGAGNPRGIFDNSGNLLVGATSPGTGNAGRVLAKQTSSGGYAVVADAVTNGGTYYLVGFQVNGTTFVGQIISNGSTTTYATSSDYRLKENILPMQGALDTVAQLKPCTYTWKNGGVAGQGFIAHELQAVVPDCVVGEKDAVDENGNPKYQGIDTSFLVATLTAAIQEQQALIQTLTERVTALEAK